MRDATDAKCAASEAEAMDDVSRLASLSSETIIRFFVLRPRVLAPPTAAMPRPNRRASFGMIMPGHLDDMNDQPDDGGELSPRSRRALRLDTGRHVV